MPGQWTPEHPEPARIVARPVDPLERHAYNFRAPAARAAPQDLFYDLLVRDRAGMEMRVELAVEHAAREIRSAQVPDGLGVNPASVVHHQIDHGRVGRVRMRRSSRVRGIRRRA